MSDIYPPKIFCPILSRVVLSHFCTIKKTMLDGSNEASDNRSLKTLNSRIDDGTGRVEHTPAVKTLTGDYTEQ